MDGIGSYLYNLRTGETVGVKRGENNPETQTSGESVTQNGQSYDILAGASIQNAEYGTVEDLSLDQLVTLFLQGDLTVDELEKGLKSKEAQTFRGAGIANIDIKQDGDTITVTFGYRETDCGCERKYTLVCNTQTAKSQLDDKEQNRVTGSQVQELVSKFCLTKEVFDKYFTLVSEASYTGKSGTDAVYQINGGMTLGEIRAELEAQNYVPSADGTFTEDLLYAMGFTSEIMIRDYFDKNPDGTYVLKQGMVLPGSGWDSDELFDINNIKDLQRVIVSSKADSRNLTYSSFEYEYQLKDNGPLPKELVKALSQNPELIRVLMSGELDYSGASNKFEYSIFSNLNSKNILSNERLNAMREEYQRYQDFLESTKNATFEEFIAAAKENGYFELYEKSWGNGYGGRYDLGKIKERYNNPYDKDRLRHIDDYVYQNIASKFNLEEDIQNYINGLANDLGKSADTVTYLDFENSLRGHLVVDKDANIQKQMQRRGYDIETFYKGLMEGRYSAGVYRHSNSCDYAILEYIKNLDPNVECSATMQAIYKAAGVTDDGNLNGKYNKVKNLVEGKTWEELWEYMYLNGFIPENGADMPLPEPRNEEYHDVLGVTIMENFLNRDVDDKSIIDDLDKTENGYLTEAEFNTNKDSYTIPTQEEKDELAQQVLDKLINDGPFMHLYGNRSYGSPHYTYYLDWLQVLVDSMGGTDYRSLFPTDDGLRKIVNSCVYNSPDRGLVISMSYIEFTFNGHTYRIGTAPAEGSLPDGCTLHDSSEIEELRKLGADDDLINKYFVATSYVDGAVIKYMFNSGNGFSSFEELKEHLKNQSK